MSVAAPPDPEHMVDAEGFQRLSGATPVQMANLEAYRLLLLDWNSRMNLVGPKSMDHYWDRHAWDSAQLLSLAPEAKIWADLGTGAGLPGIILAIFFKGREGHQVHLVESMAKRCRFLTEVVTQLELPATVHHARAEQVSLSVDIVTARACAPLSRLLGYGRPYLKRGAEALFLKGQDVASELEDATRYWGFEADILPSQSDARGRIVRVRKLLRGKV